MWVILLNKENILIISNIFVKTTLKLLTNLVLNYLLKEDVSLESSKSPISNNKFKREFE